MAEDPLMKCCGIFIILFMLFCLGLICWSKESGTNWQLFNTVE